MLSLFLIWLRASLTQWDGLIPMNVDTELVEKFADALRAKGKLPATVESYCRDAKEFLSYLERNRLPKSQVEPQTLVSYQAHLSTDGEDHENSVRRKVIGVRQFFRFLTDTRTIQSTPFDDVPIPSRLEQLPQGLEEKQILRLMGACQSPSQLKESRDSAILGLLAYEGLKANELIELTWVDFIHAGSEGSLRIRGQRNRSIVLQAESLQRLALYKERFEGLIPAAKKAECSMFIAFKGKDGASLMPTMTRHGLKFMLYELGEKTGIAHLNTELLRHHAVSFQLGLGRSPEEIMHHFGLRRMGNIAKHAATLPRKKSRGAHP